MWEDVTDFFHIFFLKAAIDFRMAAADFGGKLSKTLAFLAWLGCMDQLLGRSQVDSYSDLATKKSANSQNTFVEFSPEKKTQGTSKKQGKTRPWCHSSHGCHGQPWPTMAILNGLVEVTSRQQIVPTTTPWPFNSMVLRTACSGKLSEEVKIRFLNIERIISYNTTYTSRRRGHNNRHNNKTKPNRLKSHLILRWSFGQLQRSSRSELGTTGFACHDRGAARDQLATCPGAPLHKMSKNVASHGGVKAQTEWFTFKNCTPLWAQNQVHYMYSNTYYIVSKHYTVCSDVK